MLDKDYHSNEVLVRLNELGKRGYVSEPDRGRRHWEGKEAEQKQVYANRRRLRGERNKRLQKKRTELGERSFAHLYETGGMRRPYLRGRDNILKRLLVHGAGFNLGLLMRASLGVGKPRQFQGLQGLLDPMIALIWRLLSPCRPSLASFAFPWVSIDCHALRIPPAILATVAA